MFLEKVYKYKIYTNCILKYEIFTIFVYKIDVKTERLQKYYLGGLNKGSEFFWVFIVLGL